MTPFTPNQLAIARRAGLAAGVQKLTANPYLRDGAGSARAAAWEAGRQEAIRLTQPQALLPARSWRRLLMPEGAEA